MYLMREQAEPIEDYIAALPYLGDVVDHISDDQTIWVLPAIGPLATMPGSKDYAVLQSSSFGMAFRHVWFFADFLDAIQEASALEEE